MKYLNITDEFSKEALAIEVERSMSANDIATILERPINVHWAPEFARMDNGTEMTSDNLANRNGFSAANITFTDPGLPLQNAYVECFNGKLCDELLRIEIFATLLEAKILPSTIARNYNRNDYTHPWDTGHETNYSQTSTTTTKD